MSDSNMPWFQRIANLADSGWWKSNDLGFEAINVRGRGTRYKLTDETATTQMIIAPLATDITDCGILASVMVLKAFDAATSCCLLRMTVKTPAGADQFYDLTMNPFTGEFSAPSSAEYKHGSVIDAIDAWRVSLICTVPAAVKSSVQITIAPACGAKPGKYEPGARGSVTIRDLAFRYMSPAAYVKQARDWAVAGT
jgi:hypothetical protein